MTNIQPNKTDTESKLSHFAGIDVGAEELVLVILKNGKPIKMLPGFVPLACHQRTLCEQGRATGFKRSL